MGCFYFISSILYFKFNIIMGRRQVVKAQDFDSCIRQFESDCPSLTVDFAAER